MFFQTIYPMLAAGADLSINIKRVNDRLSVAVMPRHNGVKDEAQQHLVPLILNGTAVELDAEFLQAIMMPVSRTMGVLANLETFERQAAKVSSESRPAKTAQEKEAGKDGEAVEKDRRGGSRPKIFRSPDLAEAGKGAGSGRQAEGNRRPYPGGAENGRCGKPVRRTAPTNPRSTAAADTTTGPARVIPCSGPWRTATGFRTSTAGRTDADVPTATAGTAGIRAARTICRTTTRISATDAGRTALLSTARTGRAATGAGTARHGTRVPYPATGHAGSIQLRQGRRERQGTAPQRPLCGIHRLPGRIPGEGRGTDGTRMLLT